jgi:hypothetical protein
MGTEFSLKKVSPALIQAFEDFGEMGFNVFDKADLLDEDEGDWTEDRIDEFFYSDGESEFPGFPRERILPILLEGQQIDQSLDRSESFNGRFIEGVNFLLAGKRQFHFQDFIIDRPNFGSCRPNHRFYRYILLLILETVGVSNAM